MKWLPILVKVFLEELRYIADLLTEKNVLDLVLSVSEPPHLYLGFTDSANLEKWKKALLSVKE